MQGNLFKPVAPRILAPGIVAFEKCIETFTEVIDIMNSEVDEWKKNNVTRDGQGYGKKNGPVRFSPEDNFKKEESIKYFKQVKRNTMVQAASYLELYPEAEMEINWMESWQYISYRPPKHMEFHSDNHSVRNPDTNEHFIAPYLRRFTALTYMNDDFKGGDLVFRYFPEMGTYKAPAGSVVFMPSAFVYSHATTPLLNGRKTAFLVSFSSHYDVDSRSRGEPMEVTKLRELR
jgi:predicted 2-oxoglutarate/Fe(II)-dependent dioxygenase YbiX